MRTTGRMASMKGHLDLASTIRHLASIPPRYTGYLQILGTSRFAGRQRVRLITLVVTFSDKLTIPALKKHSVASGLSEFGDNVYVSPRDGSCQTQVVAMRMEIQIYEMEHGVYLVDFKVDGYETPNGRLLEDKEVTSPFPFLDLAARLIMQLADAD
jgi:hypothetical protein